MGVMGTIEAARAAADRAARVIARATERAGSPSRRAANWQQDAATAAAVRAVGLPADPRLAALGLPAKPSAAAATAANPAAPAAEAHEGAGPAAAAAAAEPGAAAATPAAPSHAQAASVVGEAGAATVPAAVRMSAAEAAMAARSALSGAVSMSAPQPAAATAGTLPAGYPAPRALTLAERQERAKPPSAAGGAAAAAAAAAAQFKRNMRVAYQGRVHPTLIGGQDRLNAMESAMSTRLPELQVSRGSARVWALVTSVQLCGTARRLVQRTCVGSRAGPAEV